MTKSLRKLRGIYSDALRAASLSDEFIAWGQANTPFSVIGDWSVSRKRNAPGIVPPSRRRSGCSPAAPYLPARRLDFLQDVAKINQGGEAPCLSISNCAAISIGAARNF